MVYDPYFYGGYLGNPATMGTYGFGFSALGGNSCLQNSIRSSLVTPGEDTYWHSAEKLPKNKRRKFLNKLNKIILTSTGISFAALVLMWFLKGKGK